MNNDEYLAALKRALSGMDRAAREEILREIRSHIEELGAGESLHDRFGSAQELAAGYLDGEPLPEPASRKVLGVGKKLLMGLGALTVAALALPALLYWILPEDDFDYADENAAELQIDSANWRSVEWSEPLQLRIDQAHVVLYWHDQSRISWSCDRAERPPPVPGQALEIRHDNCLIYLPVQAVALDISQAGVVLVRPRADTQIEIRQANLRIAEDQSGHRYQLDLHQAESDSFNSREDAQTLIAIAGREAMVERYEYR